jgi:hypothetical protein
MTNLEQSLEDRVNDLTGRVRPQLEEAKRRLQSINGRATDFIKEHPAACLVGAAALGYLVARLARRQQS